MINLLISFVTMLCTDSEQIANIDKIVEMKQNIINQQKIVINLMRNLPKTTSKDEQSLQKKIDDVYFKYDEAIHEMQNSEVIECIYYLLQINQILSLVLICYKV